MDQRFVKPPIVKLAAAIAACIAIWFGQVAVERLQSLADGRAVAWSQDLTFRLPGWILPSIALAITALALATAVTIWRMYTASWIALAALWTAVTLLCVPGVFLERPVSSLKLVYFAALVLLSVQSVIYLRRAVPLRSNNRIERTRVG